MEKNKKSMILAVIAVISFILVTVGTTLAFFNYVKEGSTENTIETGSISFIYEEVNRIGNGISIEDALPTSDNEGKAQTNYFDFKISSSVEPTVVIPYEITTRVVDGSDDLTDYVKLYLTKVNGNSEEQKVLSIYSDLDDSTNRLAVPFGDKTLYESEIPAGAINFVENYRLRMWLDESVDFTDGTFNNKTFSIKVNVYANGEQATGQKIITANSTGISSVKVNNTTVSETNTSEYDFFTEVDYGVSQAEIEVELDNPRASASIVNITNQAFNTRVQRLSTTQSFNLIDGDNYFRISVTSENGRNTSNYILKVSYVKDSDATLKTLSVSGCNINFSSNTTNYTCSLSRINSVNITAEANSEKATVTGTGTIPISVGTQTLTVLVTAEDDTELPYYIEITMDNSYSSSAEILEDIQTTSTKKIAACDINAQNKYENCDIYSNIDSAIAYKTNAIIILTEDITTSDAIEIASGKNIVLTLNGNKIVLNGQQGIRNDGTLRLDGSAANSEIKATNRLITNSGTVVIDGGRYYRTGSVSNDLVEVINNSTNSTNAVITIENGTFEDVARILRNGGTGSVININGGTFTSRERIVFNDSQGTVNINGGTFAATGTVYDGSTIHNSSGTTNINGGTFTSASGPTVVNSSSGTININGGKYISSTKQAVLNDYTGTININNDSNKIYIKTNAVPSAAGDYYNTAAIVNKNSGTIRITANQANSCTASDSATSSGLCVYAAGDGSANASGNAALLNHTTGSVYVNGGTYYGGVNGFRNNNAGSIRVLNAKVESRGRALTNTGAYAGKMYVCSSTIKGNEYDLYNTSTNTGTIKYSSTVIFSSNNNTPTYVAGNGSITSGYTGTCQ